MAWSTTIAVDMMSGDSGLDVTLPAVQHFALKNPDVFFLLVGDADKLGALSDLANVTLVHASECVAMDESPLLALKKKKQSSMRVAIDLVKAGRANVAVSAGNTGALVAISKFVLRMLPGFKRPVLAGMTGALHANDHGTLMLDLGATVDGEPHHLLQYAHLGSAAFKAITGDDASPKVALLNNGAEQIKGNAVVKAAAALFEADVSLNYYGFVEGDQLVGCPADVVVVDGFVGNVVVKTVEGLLKHLKVSTQRLLKTSPWLIAFIPLIRFVLRSALGPVKKDTGALLLGMHGLVVKAHGSASQLDFCAVLTTAKTISQRGLLDDIKKFVKDPQRSCPEEAEKDG